MSDATVKCPKCGTWHTQGWGIETAQAAALNILRPVTASGGRE